MLQEVIYARLKHGVPLMLGGHLFMVRVLTLLLMGEEGTIKVLVVMILALVVKSMRLLLIIMINSNNRSSISNKRARRKRRKRRKKSSSSSLRVNLNERNALLVLILLPIHLLLQIIIK